MLNRAARACLAGCLVCAQQVRALRCAADALPLTVTKTAGTSAFASKNMPMDSSSGVAGALQTGITWRRRKSLLYEIELDQNSAALDRWTQSLSGNGGQSTNRPRQRLSVSRYMVNAFKIEKGFYSIRNERKKTPAGALREPARSVNRPVSTAALAIYHACSLRATGLRRQKRRWLSYHSRHEAKQLLPMVGTG